MSAIGKGSQGEREFTKYLSFNFGIEVKRQLGQAREGGADVLHYPFCFEVKRREALDQRTWWNQVVKAAKNLEEDMPWIPVVAFRQNRREWTFLIPAKFIGLDKGYLQLENHEFKKWLKMTLNSQVYGQDYAPSDCDGPVIGLESPRVEFLGG